MARRRRPIYNDIFRWPAPDCESYIFARPRLQTLRASCSLSDFPSIACSRRTSRTSATGRHSAAIATTTLEWEFLSYVAFVQQHLSQTHA